MEIQMDNYTDTGGIHHVAYMGSCQNYVYVFLGVRYMLGQIL